MECLAFDYILDFELERPTSAKSLEIQHFLQINTKLFTALSMVTTAKRLWSASRYDMTSGSHNIGFVCLVYIFCVSFLIFSFTILKTDSLQGVSFDVFNLSFVDIFPMQASKA